MTVQLAPDKLPSPEPVSGMQAWKRDYPWLHRALEEIGPGARSASESWRTRIEDDLGTTLDFKVRPDGTAAVWCGMSGYDFRHEPTPKELFEGLVEAFRRERERKRASGSNPWKMSADVRPTPTETQEPQPSRVPPARAAASLTRALGAVLVVQGMQLLLIFLTVTALTLVLTSVGTASH